MADEKKTFSDVASKIAVALTSADEAVRNLNRAYAKTFKASAAHRSSSGIQTQTESYHCSPQKRS
jgi:hypothetical protein